MYPLGRAAVLVLCSVLLAACGDQTSLGSGADDPITARARPPPEATPLRDAQREHDRARRARSPDAGGRGVRRAAVWCLLDGERRRLVLVRPEAMPSRCPARTTPSRRWATAWSVPPRSTTGELVRAGRQPRGGLAGDEPQRHARGHPDGAIVGWVTTEGRRHVVEHGGSQEWDFAVVDEAGSIAALVGPATPAWRAPTAVGRGVRELRRGNQRPLHELARHRRTVPGVLAVGDVSAEGDLAAMTSVSDEGSCWARLRRGRRSRSGRPADHTLFDFSPSGTRILAGPAYFNRSTRLATVLDADGAVGRRSQRRPGGPPAHHLGGRRPRAGGGLPGRRLGDPPAGRRGTARSSSRRSRCRTRVAGPRSCCRSADPPSSPKMGNLPPAAPRPGLDSAEEEGRLLTASTIADPRAVMTDRAARDADFAAYLQARQASVLRTAYLLSGDRHTAEPHADGVRQALPGVRPVSDQGSIDGYLRFPRSQREQLPVATRLKKREHTAELLPEPTPSWTSTTTGATPPCGTWSSRCPRRPAPSWCCATTSSCPRPRPPRSSASPSAP